MFPAFVMLEGEADLHERAPFRPLRLADQVHGGFGWCAIGLACIAFDAGANDVLPRRRAAAIPGDHMVEIQILAIKNVSAILAGIAVPFKDVMPGEFDLLLREAVKHHQKNHAREADPE